jgi:arabinofuranan 3-O-arabinosyltransferase
VRSPAPPIQAASPRGKAISGEWGLRSRRVFWLGLAVIILGLPFISLPGRYIADTHDVLWFAPDHYLRHSFTLWQDSPFQQGQTVLQVMAAVIAAFRSLGFPPWAAERLWYGLLLFVATAGTFALVEELRGRRSIGAPLVAGLLYSLGPYTFGYGFLVSGAFAPYVLLPVLLLVTARGMEQRTLWWSVLFGLTVFAMGGGNGAPQAYAALPVVAFALWVVFVERSVPLARAVEFLGWSLVFAIGLNSYWLLSVAPHDLRNALSFSEQPQTINEASSYSETIRGLGFWQYYGGTGLGPWDPTVRRYVTDPLLIATGFAVPVVAVLSAWLVRWRFRLFFLALAILAVVGMAGAFPTSSPTPFGHLLLWSYAHVPGVAGLRTTYKLGGTLNLSLAVLAAVGVEESWSRLRALRNGQLWRLLAAAATVFVVAASAVPLWTGGIRGQGHARGLPRYWQRALADLARREGPYRAFFAPGALLISYRWGSLLEGVAETRPSIDSVVPWPFPVNEHYQTNFVAGIEQAYQQDIASNDTATLFRYLGVRDVVLQNDVNWQQSITARPAQMQVLANDRSLRAVTTYGLTGEDTTASGGSGPFDLARVVENQLPPVQILTVPNPERPARLEAGRPVVVSGDGFGLASAARAGVLGSNRPVLYSANLGSRELATLGADDPSFVITDSNRRRAYSFDAPIDNHSYTLPRGATLAGRPIGYGLFGGRQDAQSVAVYRGVRSITASGYGSAFGDQPQFQPANAFDGDPDTQWSVGGLGDPLGAWVQVRFVGAIRVGSVRLVTPGGPGRRVSAVRLSFSNGSSVVSAVKRGVNTVAFPPRTTRSLRVEIVGVGGSGENGVGFVDIIVPGVRERTAIAVPTDLLRTGSSTAAGRTLLIDAPLTYLFDRARQGPLLGGDEERGIVRLFSVSALRSFVLRGTAHLDSMAPDDQIDRLIRGNTDVQATSSSRLFDNPRVRASAALDGKRATAWLAAGTTGQWLRVTFPPRVLDHLSLLTDKGPGRTPITNVRLTFSDGSSVPEAVNTTTGRLDASFSRRMTSSVTVTLTKVAFAGAGGRAPVGIDELQIPGVRLPTVEGSAPPPCAIGPGFTLDGVPVPVRISGTIDELLGGDPATLSTCDGSPLTISAGRHEFIAQSALQPDTILLASPGASVGGSTLLARPRFTITPNSGAGLTVRVGDAKSPFFLVSGHDYAPGWSASIGGTSLGPPMVLDGYAAGWRVSHPGSYTITVRYVPQLRYDAGLMVTAAFLVLSLILVAIGIARRKRT